MNAIIVSAAILEHDGKILIAQRKPNAYMGLKWEFPGGKIEENESPRECLAREIKEELDLEIEVGEAFDIVYHRYPEKNVLMLVYKCKLVRGQPKTIDCNDFKWIEPSELEKFDYPAADLPIVQKLIRE
jgi:8-oxo-dGTP diphosphatase